MPRSREPAARSPARDNQNAPQAATSKASGATPDSMWSAGRTPGSGAMNASVTAWAATMAVAASAAASVRCGSRPRLWRSAVASIALSFCFTIVDRPIAGHQGHRGIRGGELRISQTGVL